MVHMKLEEFTFLKKQEGRSVGRLRRRTQHDFTVFRWDEDSSRIEEIGKIVVRQ